MLDTVKINHVQHISFTQSRLTDAVSVILSELLSYEHPSKRRGLVPTVFFYKILLLKFPLKIISFSKPRCPCLLSSYRGSQQQL